MYWNSNQGVLNSPVIYKNNMERRRKFWKWQRVLLVVCAFFSTSSVSLYKR